MLAGGCGRPGGDSPQATATGTSLSTAPVCGTAPVTLNGYFEAGFPMPKALTTEFGVRAVDPRALGQLFGHVHKCARIQNTENDINKPMSGVMMPSNGIVRPSINVRLDSP